MHLQTLSIYLQKLKLKYLFGFQVHLQMDFSKQIQEYIYFKEKVFSIKVFEEWHFRVQKKSFGCVKLKKEFQHSICHKDLLCCTKFVKLFLQLFVQKIINTFILFRIQNLLIIVYHIIYMFMKMLFIEKMEHLLITIIILEILPDSNQIDILESFSCFLILILIKISQFVMKQIRFEQQLKFLQSFQDFLNCPFSEVFFSYRNFRICIIIYIEIAKSFQIYQSFQIVYLLFYRKLILQRMQQQLIIYQQL
ncbi:unnamed protein product [Paramecium primaurelia]|uniref:Transmembrane protein n=1 Tax=Paramecium primaurelia TaxID=5886 RepID=A0A8S1L6M9_PARPR|nr:unnamed protein product [Paramecium primaurelia]